MTHDNKYTCQNFAFYAKRNRNAQMAEARDSGSAVLEKHAVMRRSFTLIELLVVIAIIAILAGLLLPTLSAAKEVGKRAACAANMKNMSIHYYIYSADNNDFMMPQAQYGDDSRLENGYQGGKKLSWYDAMFLQAPESRNAPNAFYKIKNMPRWLKCPSGGFWNTENNIFGIGNCNNYDMVELSIYATYLYPTGMTWQEGNAYRAKKLKKISSVRKSPSSYVKIIEGGKQLTSRYVIPGTARGPFMGKSTPNIWRNDSGDNGVSAFSDVIATIFNTTPPASQAQMYGMLRRDLMKGRHANSSLGMFLDGHVETRAGLTWGQWFWIDWKNNSGPFCAEE